MNRPLLLAFFLALFALSELRSQELDLCRQVVAVAGKSAVMAGRYWSYTVGEPAITTQIGTERIVTQGFHQPQLCALTFTSDLDPATWQLAVFPNPTAGPVTIRYAADRGALEATVFDLLGRLIVYRQPLSDPQGSRLDAGPWKAGIYLLHLRDPRTGATATYRLIRL
jgi:hypothetical protein